jgi:hypothetical protein
MRLGVRVTIVASQGEGDVICSMLRAEGIKCDERSTVGADESGTWREVLVEESDLAAAQELLAGAR